MTIGTTSGAPARSTPPESRTPRGGSGSRRPLWLALGGVGVVVLLIVIAAVASSTFADLRDDSLQGGPADPRSAAPSGGRALVQILRAQGIDVEVVRGLDSFSDADRPGSDTTVVLSEAEALNAGTAEQFRARTADAHRVVHVSPSSVAFEYLRMPVRTALTDDVETTTAGAGCSAPGIAATDVATVGPLGIATVDPQATSCFTVGHASGFVLLPRTALYPETAIFNQDMLVNQHLAQHDNAGVALRVIGSTPKVLWYVPDPYDRVGEESEISLPRALGPLLLLAVIGVFALMLWRGRRFGPLIDEPLPAVVKAIETTAARGRLYHRARADARAAAALRIHVLTALGRYLGIPFDAARHTDELARADWETDSATGPFDAAQLDPALAALVTAVTGTTGRPATEVHALLAGPLPRTDAELLQFTTDLTTLEKEVRRTP